MAPRRNARANKLVFRYNTLRREYDHRMRSRISRLRKHFHLLSLALDVLVRVRAGRTAAGGFFAPAVSLGLGMLMVADGCGMFHILVITYYKVKGYLK